MQCKQLADKLIHMQRKILQRLEREFRFAASFLVRTLAVVPTFSSFQADWSASWVWSAVGSQKYRHRVWCPPPHLSLQEPPTKDKPRNKTRRLLVVNTILDYYFLTESVWFSVWICGKMLRLFSYANQNARYSLTSSHYSALRFLWLDAHNQPFPVLCCNCAIYELSPKK